jgi:hypothetical protein
VGGSAGDGVAGAQIEAADLAGRDIDVIRPGHVGAVGGAQEAEAILQNLQHPVAVDLLAILGVRLEDGKDDILLARTGGAFHAHGLGDIDDSGSGFLFQFSQSGSFYGDTRAALPAHSSGLG